MAWNYSDNQPSYTSMEPEGGYKSIAFKTVIRGPEEHVDADDFCDPTRQKLLVEYAEVQGMVSRRDKASVLGRYFDHRCYCEHDCCGHRFGGADVTILDDKYALVEIYSSRNY